MSFTKYEGLGTPNQVLQKMRDYIHQEGFTIVDDIKDDLDIFDRNITDGKKLVFKDKTDNYFVSLRSMEGYQIFPEMAGGVTNPSNSTLPTQPSGRFSGIGCIASDGYSPTNRWYEQYLAPKKYGTNTVVGSCLKMAGETPKITTISCPIQVPTRHDINFDGTNYTVFYPYFSVGATQKSFVRFLDSTGKPSTYIPAKDNINLVGKLYWDLSFINTAFVQQAFNDFQSLVSQQLLSVNTVNGTPPTIFYPLDLKLDNHTLITNPVGLRVSFNFSSFHNRWTIYPYIHNFRLDNLNPTARNNIYVKHTNETFNNFVANTANNKYFLNSYTVNDLNFPTGVILPPSVSSLVFCDSLTYNVTNPSGLWANNFAYYITVSGTNTVEEYTTLNNVISKDIIANKLFGVDVNITNQAQNVTYLNPSTLYCNHITQPTDTLIFTLVDKEGKINNHLIIGNLNKYANWEGGIFISGSHNSYNVSNEVYSPTSFLWNTPVLGTTDAGATTFCRINVDEAPTRAGIYWASNGQPNVGSGADCYTGKQLVTPIRYGTAISGTWTAKIPHYGYLQSRSSVDAGVNSNTLNCISMNLPIYFAVKVDPDSLNNFAPIGEVSGVYLVSLLNMASASSYEVSYPTSGNLHQVFSMNRRRGLFGFDGISIKQEVNE